MTIQYTGKTMLQVLEQTVEHIRVALVWSDGYISSERWYKAYTDKIGRYFNYKGEKVYVLIFENCMA